MSEVVTAELGDNKAVDAAKETSENEGKCSSSTGADNDDNLESSSGSEDESSGEDSDSDSDTIADDPTPLDTALPQELAMEKAAFKKTRLRDRPKCVMCAEATAKYQCPACSAVTCCLGCVKAHKAKYKCTGTASRGVSFVAIKDFSDKQITDDYHFLQAADHSAMKAKRMFGKDFGGIYVDRTKSKRRKGSKHPAPFFRGSEALLHYPATARCLVRGAEQRGVKLLLLPPGMSKRKENTSFMNNHSSTMFWRVKWAWKEALVQVDLFEKKMDEGKTLKSALEKYLIKNASNTETRLKLKPYCEEVVDSLCLFVRREQTPANQVVYDQIFPHQTLREALKDKTIIEFPEIHVATSKGATEFLRHD